METHGFDQCHVFDFVLSLVPGINFQHGILLIGLQCEWKNICSQVLVIKLMGLNITPKI